MFDFEFGVTEAAADGEHVVVSGPTRLREVDCRSFEATGATTVEGDLRAARVDVDGSTSVGGAVAVDELQADGSLEVTGPVGVDAATLSGSVRIDGDLCADRLVLTGAAKLAEVTADELDVEGTVSASALTAERVDVTGVVALGSVTADVAALSLTDESTVDRLDAARIDVERADAGGGLEATEIVGDDVTLAHTRAETVTGDRVTVGPGCEIQVVRSPDVDVDPDASVGTVEEGAGT